MAGTLIPFDELGGEAPVRALVELFYDVMDRDEPELGRLHPLDDAGRVSRASRDRFALFLVGWLGGPQDYVAAHGHPRLRMRHARVPVDGTSPFFQSPSRSSARATRAWLHSR